MRRVIGTYLVLQVLAGGPAVALAHGTDQGQLLAPPHQMFQAMLLYAEQGEFARVEKGLAHVQPLLEEVRRHFGADLGGEVRQAAARHDRRATEAAILKLVFHDMKHDLETVLDQEETRQVRLVSLRLAYLDFLLLEPRVDRQAGRPAGATSRRFKVIYQRMQEARPAGAALDAALVEQIQAIERECLGAFPEWKIP